MTPEIATVLFILAIAVVLFVTERIRIDVVALLVLVSLAVTGLVTPGEALSGLSNPAVVTVWAVLILSGGLSRTGVAGIIGRQVLRLAGSGEIRLLVIIMATVGILSGFMNDIGVASLFMPVAMDIARRTGIAPSKLLIPLAFASLLGGLNTLIGTPPNILISEALRGAGLEPFSLFDYTPVGIFVTASGIAFMALVGRRLLPSRGLAGEVGEGAGPDLREVYELGAHLFTIRVPEGSSLAGMTLAQSRIGAALGLNVLAVLRDTHTALSPAPNTLLREGDRLLVEGQPDRLAAEQDHEHLIVEEITPRISWLSSRGVEFAEAEVGADASLIGQTLPEIRFRQRFGAIVLAIRRGEDTRLTDLARISLKAGDRLLVEGSPETIEAMRGAPEFVRLERMSEDEVAASYRLQERLFSLRVPEGSGLAGRTLTESRLGAAYGLAVLGILRDEDTLLVPDTAERLEPGDVLVVKGRQEVLEAMRDLEDLEIDQQAALDLGALESDRVGMVEAVLSPHTTLAGQTLRELRFREKYGLSVLAFWREGRAYRADLQDIAIRMGDALLIHGPREKIKLLGAEPDFLVLTEAAQEVPRASRAPAAVLVMAAVLVPVILGWLPISIAAVMGVTLMVLTGSLTMEEAYRYIEWRAIFLIAGMLPLGIAMEQTGAAQFLAEGMVAAIGGLGPLAVVAGFYIIAALASQVMPNPAVAVLLAPVALSTAGDLGISPYPLMMTVAVSASAAFLSPVAHPANLLVMGPGGYRFADYLKVGVPLTLVVMAVVLVVLPIVWPFNP